MIFTLLLFTIALNWDFCTFSSIITPFTIRFALTFVIHPFRPLSLVRLTVLPLFVFVIARVNEVSVGCIVELPFLLSVQFCTIPFLPYLNMAFLNMILNIYLYNQSTNRNRTEFISRSLLFSVNLPNCFKYKNITYKFQHNLKYTHTYFF